MKKISVIVPVYKVEAYLDPCVESLLSQTHKELEIFLIDDGSPDNCPHMCDTWAEKDARIRVIHKENGGQGSARNTALDLMTGDYVLFVDSDDMIHPQMCEILLFFLEKEAADISFCDFFLFSSLDEISLPSFSVSEHTCERISTLSWLRSGVTYNRSEVACKLYSKKLFDSLRFRTDIAFEDTHIFPYLLKSADTMVHCALPLYFYRQNPVGAMRSSLSAKKFTILDIYAEHYRMYRKEGWHKVAAIAVGSIVLRMIKASVLRKKFALSSVFWKYWFRYLFLVLFAPRGYLTAKQKVTYLSTVLPFPRLHRLYRTRFRYAINFEDENNL